MRRPWKLRRGLAPLLPRRRARRREPLLLGLSVGVPAAPRATVAESGVHGVGGAGPSRARLALAGEPCEDGGVSSAAPGGRAVPAARSSSISTARD